MEALSTLHLLRPWWLLALPVYGLLVYGFLRSQRSQSGWSALCDPALLTYMVGNSTKQDRRSPWLPAALLLGGLLLLTALAGPVWQALPQPVYRAHSGMVIILDLSRSMDAGDLKPSRLQRAKQKVQDILHKRTEGETGLVVFAGSAFDVVPMTTDNKAILALLPSLDTSMMPVQGSVASDALKHAGAMLKRGAIKHGSVVMLTDGVDADATAVAKELAAAGHHLSILGVGTAEGAPIPLSDGGFLQDKQGNIVIPRLQKEQLAALAAAGDGIYQQMRADDLDVERLPGLHPARDTGETRSHMQTDQWREEGPWLVLLMLPLLALVFRRGVLLLLIVVPLAMPSQAHASTWRDLWQTPDQQGQALMQQGSAKAAAGRFTDPAWRGAALYKSGQFDKAAKALEGVHTADGWYNRGNALARAGKLQEAIAAYDQTLKLKPTDADATFNRKLVEKLLQQQKQQKQKQQQKSGQGKQGQKQPNKPNQQGQKQQSGKQQSQSGGKKGANGKQSGKEQGQGSRSKQESGKQQGEQKAGGNKSSQSGSDSAKSAQAKKEKPSEKDGSPSTNQAQTDKTEANKQPAGRAQKSAGAGQSDKQVAAAADEATTEKQMEKENARRQWLRRIPDDPGGLLRRKFLYQYQHQGGQSTEAQTW
ncbi:VWA domain-containing protein [Mariprofundus ferrooxydans]|uniref:VWA domain-containing protein n=1 Tax=Mariprofundus ferrooxydans TaxID=314344 RepID=UPI00142F5AEC|nr:VWA domain-containing protein [Mariprofundus ferrooxydans]